MIFYFPFTGEFFTTMAWTLIIVFVACIVLLVIGVALIAISSPFMIAYSLWMGDIGDKFYEWRTKKKMNKKRKLKYYENYSNIR